MNKKVMNIAMAILSLGYVVEGSANYVRTFYNATPFEATVYFDVDAIGIRQFKVSPGQAVRWSQPNIAAVNLLRKVHASVNQKYLPKGYDTGILDPDNRIGRDSRDENFDGYVIENYDAPAGLAGDWSFILVGPTFADPNNARRATYRVSRVVDDVDTEIGVGRLQNSRWPVIKE